MKILYDHKRKKERETKVKYSKELHDYWRSQSKADFPETPSLGVVFYLLDEIERLNAERRWIPVSERLPEREDKSCIGERYLVLYLNYFEDICVYAPYDKLWFREGVDKTEYVTHWMPLPEPPEEK